MNILTNKEAFVSIYEFLDIQYHKGYEDLGGFLGSIALCEDGSPIDSALWGDWLKIIKNKKNLSIEDAYLYLFKFLDFQSNLGWPEIGEFLATLPTDYRTNLLDSKTWNEWNIAIEKSKLYPDELLHSKL